MALHKIVNLANPVNPQDMATKAYVDSVMGFPTPADISIMLCPWAPGWTEATIRSQYITLLSMGINAFMSYVHQENYRDNPDAMYWYDRVYDLAAEYGIKILWFCGGWGNKNPDDTRYRFINPNEDEPLVWIDRYKAKPACLGWLWMDEPLIQPWGDYDVFKWAYDDIKGLDPAHPCFPVFNYGPSYAQIHNGADADWGSLYDIGFIDAYPYSLWGENPLGPPGGLHYWINYTYERVDIDGFGEPPNDVKPFWPCIQTFIGALGNPSFVPPQVPQYNKWLEFYGSQLQGIGLWTGGAIPSNPTLIEYIKDLARLRGWSG